MNKINIKEIYNILLDKYGPQGWWPVRRDAKFCVSTNRYEIVVGAILTQNTAWTNVEKAVDNLIILGLMDPKVIMDIDQDDLANAIRSSGYYNQKAKKLKILTRYLMEGNFLQSENIPERDDLLKLWGIGEETVDSILLYAYGVPVFVIDAYTRRIFERLGILSGGEQYEVIAGVIADSIEEDPEVYKEFHALIVRHGKEHCRKTPDCITCILKDFCLY